LAQGVQARLDLEEILEAILFFPQSHQMVVVAGEQE
jgi:hypothetical protein